MSEDTAERDTPEKDPPPAGPRGVDGETRVVAERSGSDTTFPERPLLADPDDARRTPEEESPEGATDAGTDDGDGDGDGEDTGGSGNEAEGDAGEDTSGDGTPEPEVGPAS
ncbi:hypothetical protein [Streptosporangium sp. V21-05]|uniref:hypothetical protein n=1 Tax=Streptosporangium sp. V21-05 TaxID=3446115 RepID=UPI003F52E32B